MHFDDRWNRKKKETVFYSVILKLICLIFHIAVINRHFHSMQPALFLVALDKHTPHYT